MSAAQEITRHYGGDWHGSYGSFPAPGHSKSDRGVTVKDAPGGDVVLYSFNGADWREIKDECRRVGLLPEREPRANGDKGPRETDWFEYADASGAVVYRTVRVEQVGRKKRFKAQRPDGRGGWISGMGDIKRVPYRLPDILAADPGEPVYLVEGERKADKLASWGFVATAVAFGCRGWRADYAAALAGRHVIILPDNDDEGRGFAQKAAKDIEEQRGTVQIVDLLGLPPKGDIMDWTGTADDLRALVEQSTRSGGLPGLCGPETWDGTKAPDREWIWPDWIVRKAAGLLGGEEGVGKSLLAQQMATCGAAGIPFLGVQGQRVRAIYITCEDDKDELHRRQETINASLGITMASLKGWLRTFSLKGEIGNDLSEQDGKGITVPTARYNQVRQAVLDFGAQLVFIDNAAHVFPGNENNRHEVAAFLGLLERLSIEINGAVVLLAHPNKQHAQGNKQGNEYSGTTGWSAHVRNRLFIDWEGGDMPNPDGRVLRRSKSNYSAKGEEIGFIWHKWAFVREEDLSPNVAAEIAAVARDNGDNALFLACLAERIKQRRAVSEKHSPTYAPSEFAKMAESKGIGKARLDKAMDRLFRIGKIERGELWKGDDRKPVFGLRETAGNGAGDTVRETRETAPNTAENRAGNAGETHTLYTTYIEGAAHEAAAPSPEIDDGLDANGDIIGWNDKPHGGNI